MTTVTKPYADFVNNVDVADAVKVNAQINAIYTFLNNPNIDFSNLAAAIYSMNSVASTLVERDTSQNIAYGLSKSGQNHNLAFNPSARMGLSGWLVTNAGGSAWSAQFGTGAEGGYFAVGNVSNAVPTLVSTKFTVAAAISLSLSGEMYTAGVTAGIQSIDIQFYDTNGTGIGAGYRINATNGQSWTKYSGTVTTPAGTVTAAVRCFGDGGFITTNSAWRKLKIEGGAIATTFSDDNTLNTQQYGSVLPLVQAVSGGNKVQSGISTVTTILNGWASITVTFPIAFSSAPIVTATFSQNGSTRVHITTSAITTTSFVLGIYNLDGAGAAGISWTAIGP